jgi:hypothetical protein
MPRSHVFDFVLSETTKAALLAPCPLLSSTHSPPSWPPLLHSPPAAPMASQRPGIGLAARCHTLPSGPNLPARPESSLLTPRRARARARRRFRVTKCNRGRPRPSQPSQPPALTPGAAPRDCTPEEGPATQWGGGWRGAGWVVAAVMVVMVAGYTDAGAAPMGQAHEGLGGQRLATGPGAGRGAGQAALPGRRKCKGRGTGGEDRGVSEGARGRRPRAGAARRGGRKGRGWPRDGGEMGLNGGPARNERRVGYKRGAPPRACPRLVQATRGGVGGAGPAGTPQEAGGQGRGCRLRGRGLLFEQARGGEAPSRACGRVPRARWMPHPAWSGDGWMQPDTNGRGLRSKTGRGGTRCQRTGAAGSPAPPQGSSRAVPRGIGGYV